LDGSDLNAANAFACLDSNLDVANISPGGSPRVLYQEVVKSVVASVADDEGSVVDLMATALVSDDTASIVREHHVVCLNSHSNRSHLESVG